MFVSDKRNVQDKTPSPQTSMGCFWLQNRFVSLPLHSNVSQVLATINFSSGEIARKTLSARKNFIGNINLGQTSHLNWDKFGIYNDIPDC